MTRCIQIFFIFCAFNLTAQKGNIVLHFPNSVVLYEDYSSILKVGFTEKRIKKFKLECEGCDTLYQKSENDPTEFVVTPGDTNKIVLKLIDRRKNIIVEQLEIKVTKPPLPTLKIDNQDSQEKIKIIPENLHLENSPNVPITAGYVIISWTIKIQDKIYTGFTSKLSEEVKNSIRQKNKGTMIIEVIYRDVYGKQEMKDIFEFEI
jgi:hypothetical protein